MVTRLCTRTRHDERRVVQRVLHMAVHLMSGIAFVASFQRRPRRTFPVHLTRMQGLVIDLSAMLIKSVNDLRPLTGVLRYERLVLLRGKYILGVPYSTRIQGVRHVGRLCRFVQLTNMALAKYSIPIPRIFSNSAGTRFIDGFRFLLRVYRVAFRQITPRLEPKDHHYVDGDPLSTRYGQSTRAPLSGHLFPLDHFNVDYRVLMRIRVQLKGLRTVFYNDIAGIIRPAFPLVNRR